MRVPIRNCERGKFLKAFGRNYLFIADFLTKSVSQHNVVGSKSSDIDGIFIIGLAFVISCILLSGRIYFHFALNRVVSYGPFVYLEQIRKVLKIDVKVDGFHHFLMEIYH